MIKNLKIGISGIIVSISYFILLYLLNSNFEARVILEFFKIEAIFVAVATFGDCVCRGKFYGTDRNSDGISLLVVIYTIALIVGVIKRDVILVLLSAELIVSAYNVYTEELAVYNGKDILVPTLMYTVGKIGLSILIIEIGVDFGLNGVQSIILVMSLSDILFSFIVKRIYWGYRVRDIIKIKVTNLGWYREEINGIVSAILKNNNVVLSKIVKIFVTSRLAGIPGIENIANFIILSQKSEVPFFNARDYNFKNKRNRIADTDGESMKTEEDISIYKIILLWYICAVLTILYFGIDIPKWYVIVILVSHFMQYFSFVGNLFFWETVLKYRNKGFAVTVYYIFIHFNRLILLFLTKSINVYLYVMIAEPVLHYIYIYILYKLDRKHLGREIKVYSIKEMIQ